MAKLTIQTIYEQYKNDVYTYLQSLTHNQSLSEDLTSEVFLAAIAALPSFKGNSGIKTWLFSIARYKWYAYLRKSKKQLSPQDFMEFYLWEDRDLETVVITKELTSRIYQLLEQEPANNRGIVLMRIKGFSYFEIAEKHGISESSARVIDFRTKNKIRINLLKEGYGNE